MFSLQERERLYLLDWLNTYVELQRRYEQDADFFEFENVRRHDVSVLRLLSKSPTGRSTLRCILSDWHDLDSVIERIASTRPLAGWNSRTFISDELTREMHFFCAPLCSIRCGWTCIGTIVCRPTAQIEDGMTRCTLHGTYRSLDVEVVDEDKGRSLGTRLRSFVLDKLMVKSSNMPDDPPLRTGTIEHEYEKGATFFKFLWHSLRSGLYSLVGL